MIANETQAMFDQRIKKACMIIFLGISDDVQPHVWDSKDVVESWKKF